MRAFFDKRAVSASFVWMLNRNIALVCNPMPGNERSCRMGEQVARLLRMQEVEHSLFTDGWPAGWEGYSEVWIVGGDGTLNWFINQYPGIELPLSIFPGGSGNDFHWMLYGDVPLETQVEKLLSARTYKLDAGSCNGKLFLNGVGIGFDGAIVKDLLGRKKMAGKATYLLSILKNIISYTEKWCRVECRDESIEQDCLIISVANARRYGGGFLVAPNAELTDGLLDLSIVGAISPLKRIRYLPVMEKGEHLGLPFIRYSRQSGVVISSSSALHCHLDGEYLYEDRFVIDVLPERFSFLLYDPPFAAGK